MSKNGKPLRFAVLIRVSTERQANKGESLRTQTTQLTQAVEQIGGTITASYAGQEHATAGYEREQLNRLLADAQKPRKPFDAVMVADPSRWSRDNVASETGLKILRDNGIRFFALTMEHDLFDPQSLLFLSLSATIGAFHARTQRQKSLLNRIERAKRGIPTGGKWPYGRTWDGTGWNVDPDKQAMVRDVAARYLAGESMPKLAVEYGVNHSNLCKVLRERCGDQWTLGFNDDELNIHECITLTIPRLLPEKMIGAIRQRLQAKRTYMHGQPKHDYLLAGRVFCAGCGYGLFGQTNPNGKRYYRHVHRPDRRRECPYTNPRPWVQAEAIESAVVGMLFNTMGNPAAIERAIKAGIPDCDKAMRNRDRIEVELAKVKRARDRVLALIEKDAITDEQAEAKLQDLKTRETALRHDLDKLAAELADIPSESATKLFVERCGDSIFLLDNEGNTYVGGNDVVSFLEMGDTDRRALIATALDGNLPDGSPAGVYVTPSGGSYHGSKRFSYVLRGRLIRTAGRVAPRAKR